MFQKITLVSVLLFSLQVSYAYPTHPNPAETIGELCDPSDIDFVEYRYSEKIPYCVRNVDTRLKTEIYEVYGIPADCRHRYTIDHLIPLSLGGNNAYANLWPEHKLVKATRPTLEVDLYNALKAGSITQAKAIKTIKSAKMAAQAAFMKASTSADKCDRP